jgi:hypothetical protein
MARLLKTSRSIFLGAAFVGVLAGTGGFMGAVGGIMLMLLTRSVFGMGTGLAEFLSAGTGVGAVTAALLGVALMARQSLPLAFLPRVAASRTSDGR